MQPVLELRGVSKQFGTHLAVDDISLSIDKGAFYALLGPSGCGKTTTLRMVAGFEQPTQGEILLNGGRIEHLQALRASGQHCVSELRSVSTPDRPRQRRVRAQAQSAYPRPRSDSASLTRSISSI